MQRAKECSHFESLGSDLKEARKVMRMTRKELAERVHIDPRYLANIENSGSFPSLPVFYELVKVCCLPVEKYFYPHPNDGRSSERQRAFTKLNLCPAQYLPIIEAALDGAIELEERSE